MCSINARGAESPLILTEARDHLVAALNLIDVAHPTSILAARCQHLIDDMDALISADAMLDDQRMAGSSGRA